MSENNDPTPGTWEVFEKDDKFQIVCTAGDYVVAIARHKADAELIISVHEMMEILFKCHERCVNHVGRIDYKTFYEIKNVLYKINQKGNILDA